MTLATFDNGVLVIGAGGHSRFVISMLQAQGISIAGILDINNRPDGSETILGVPVKWGIDDLAAIAASGIRAACLAVGENASRRSVGDKVRAAGFATPNLVHPSAQVCASATLGQGNIIGPCAVIGANVIIGDNNIINSGAIIEHESRVGSHCHISLGSVMCGRTTAGDLLMLGANATILPGVTVASQVTVGAGAVVTRDIDKDGGTYAGVPAVRMR